MWYKVKKRFIWTQQVRPAWFTKSIDVRWKTLAQIQAEWWTLSNWRWSYTLDSNWITVYPQASASQSSVTLYFDLPQDLTANSKITLSATWYCTAPSGTGYAWWVLSVWIFKTVWNWYYNNQMAACYSNGSSSQAWTTWISIDSASIGSTLTRWVGWNINYTAVFDLKTKTAKFNITWPVTWTTSWTLTTAQVNTVLAYKKACIVVEEFSENYMQRLYTASITVEY